MTRIRDKEINKKKYATNSQIGIFFRQENESEENVFRKENKYDIDCGLDQKLSNDFIRQVKTFNELLSEDKEQS